MILTTLSFLSRTSQSYMQANLLKDESGHNLVFKVKKRLFWLQSRCRVLVALKWKLCFMKIILQNFTQSRSGKTDSDQLIGMLYQNLIIPPSVLKVEDMTNRVHEIEIASIN